MDSPFCRVQIENPGKNGRITYYKIKTLTPVRKVFTLQYGLDLVFGCSFWTLLAPILDFEGPFQNWNLQFFWIWIRFCQKKNGEKKQCPGFDFVVMWGGWSSLVVTHEYNITISHYYHLLGHIMPINSTNLHHMMKKKKKYGEISVSRNSTYIYLPDSLFYRIQL